MRSVEHAEMLRDVGLVPTIQRLAVLRCLRKTKQHPTADQVLSTVRRRFPSISRATVYNTLDALTKTGMILRLHVEPTVARYDADLAPHAHFHCRVCRKVYDMEGKTSRTVDVNSDGHLVELITTYAYGVCASCRERDGGCVPPPSDRNESSQKKPSASSSGPLSEGSDQPKESKTRSASVPRRSDQANSIRKKPMASSSGPLSESEEVRNA
jgi:Fur family peroxide stress response transcriptional regulator